MIVSSVQNQRFYNNNLKKPTQTYKSGANKSVNFGKFNPLATFGVGVVIAGLVLSLFPLSDKIDVQRQEIKGLKKDLSLVDSLLTRVDSLKKVSTQKRLNSYIFSNPKLEREADSLSYLAEKDFVKAHNISKQILK